MGDVGQETGQKQSMILITEGNLPNINVSKAFVEGGEHINTIPWEHALLHEKKRYLVGKYEDALGDDAAIDLAITTGADYAVHTVVLLGVGGDSLLQIYDDTTFDSNPGGSVLVPSNRSQEPAVRASTVTVLNDPTIDVLGSALIPGGGRFFPGGSAGVAQGTSGEGRDELIQPINTTFIYRLTNISGQARKTNLTLDFYEHEPIA